MTVQACTRCIKAHRACSGFKDEGTLLFRHYQPAKLSLHVPSHSTFEGAALDMFISNFVIEASDRSVSRGFLDGMQNLLKTLDPSSPLVQSAKLVALTNEARRQSHKELLGYVEARYGELLQAYRRILSASGNSDVSIETLYTAVLLGLYEV